MGKNKLNITNKDLETNEKWNCLDFIKKDYSKVDLENEADAAQLYPTNFRLKMWDINKRKPIKQDTFIHTITCNMDRSNTAAMMSYIGAKGNIWILEVVIPKRECIYKIVGNTNAGKAIAKAFEKFIDKLDLNRTNVRWVCSSQFNMVDYIFYSLKRSLHSLIKEQMNMLIEKVELI